MSVSVGCNIFVNITMSAVADMIGTVTLFTAVVILVAVVVSIGECRRYYCVS